MTDPVRIQLGSKGYALVDAIDAPAVNAVSWYLNSHGYAVRRLSRDSRGRRPQQSLHRFILGMDSSDPMQVDHINRDRLDCRRSNLRRVTHKQNHQNRPAMPGGTSEHRGVYFDSRRDRWRALVEVNGVKRHVGCFSTEQDAALAASEFRRQHMPYSVDDALADAA
jgi:hypothetical protein